MAEHARAQSHVHNRTRPLKDLRALTQRKRKPNSISALKTAFPTSRMDLTSVSSSPALELHDSPLPPALTHRTKRAGNALVDNAGQLLSPPPQPCTHTRLQRAKRRGERMRWEWRERVRGRRLQWKSFVSHFPDGFHSSYLAMFLRCFHIMFILHLCLTFKVFGKCFYSKWLWGIATFDQYVFAGIDPQPWATGTQQKINVKFY